MTTELAIAGEAAEVVLTGTDDAFTELLQELDVEELVDVGHLLSRMSGTSAIRAGRTAYEIRQKTPDGEWGKEVFRLATEWEVSERTIHRWMKGAQEHFELELTPAQLNAQASPTPDAASAGEPEPSFEWGDDEDEEAAAGFAGLPSDGTLMKQMNEEAGWGDATLPSAEYKNEDAPGATPVPMLLEPDPTWVAFTAEMIQDGAQYGDVAAERMAKARWARKLEEEPMDLLEELEMIYEAEGEALPDDTAAKLIEAEENKALKPDEVTEGGGKKKGKRGSAAPKLAYNNAEKILALLRQLHEQVHLGIKEGRMEDREAAAMLPHLVLMPHAVQGLKKMAQEAKDRALKEGPSMEDKIAATQAAEDPELPDYESEL